MNSKWNGTKGIHHMYLIKTIFASSHDTRDLSYLPSTEFIKIFTEINDSKHSIIQSSPDPVHGADF